MSDICVCCGREIPEGRQVCLSCESSSGFAPDAILNDGTPLYLKTSTPGPKNTSFQLFLYNLLNRGVKNE